MGIIDGVVSGNVPVDKYVLGGVVGLLLGAAPMAGLGVRGGIRDVRVNTALTLAGAHDLALDNRIGSLMAGKAAHFVLFIVDPLTVYTTPLETRVQGR